MRTLEMASYINSRQAKDKVYEQIVLHSGLGDYDAAISEAVNALVPD